MIELKNLEEKDGLYYVGHIADIDSDGWVTEEEALSIIASINLSNAPDELSFWKDGEYTATGGYFIRNDLKEFLNKLIAVGKEPVGLNVDLKNSTIEVIVKS